MKKIKKHSDRLFKVTLKCKSQKQITWCKNILRILTTIKKAKSHNKKLKFIYQILKQFKQNKMKCFGFYRNQNKMVKNKTKWEHGTGQCSGTSLVGWRRLFIF